jgi:DNA-binding Lrp family transcriptional regulator
MDNTDKQILTAIQADLPVEVRPFDVLAERLNLNAADVVSRVKRMAAEGLIRRVGPVFDSRGLGYVSTVAAATVPPWPILIHKGYPWSLCCAPPSPPTARSSHAS